MNLILSFSFTEKSIPSVIISHRYKAQDTPARKTFEQALTGAFMSAVIKDLRPSALPFVASLIRHYTMVAVAQQCGKQSGIDRDGVDCHEQGETFMLTVICFKKVMVLQLLLDRYFFFVCLMAELCFNSFEQWEIIKHVLETINNTFKTLQPMK